MDAKKRFLLAGVTLLASGAMARESRFSSPEIAAIQAFWNQPGRYKAEPPTDHKVRGHWQVRLTPEGSTWLRQYSRARGLGKTPPNLAAPTQPGDPRPWEQWINAKIAFDRANASLEARKKNVEVHGIELPALSIANDPGPAPRDLVSLVGDPPAFAEAAAPMQHTIVFEDGGRHSWQDHPEMRPRFEYYRFREGVMDGGTPMRRVPEAEVNMLLSRAGIDGSVRKVFTAVSLLEGGFDSVNTYDTGFVSVGFIQFAALSGGGGSLGRVMLRQKQDNPDAFDRDFARYGLDVTSEGLLVAVELGSGSTLVGPDAAMQIIEDKRLIAVFQRAGRISTPFRVAQLQIAKDEYYPVSDQIVVPIAGTILTGRVGEIIPSEAGIATLMDRKVNTGRLDPLASVLQRIATRENIRRFADFAPFEREIIEAMKWRKSYLEDTTLTQPTRKPDTNSQSSPPFSGSTPR